MILFEVRMRKFLIVSASGVLLLLASSAQAQGTWTLDAARLSTRESASTAAASSAPATSTANAISSLRRASRDPDPSEDRRGGVFDIGAAYRIGANWGVGFAFNTAAGSGDATVAGTLPHPLVFDQPRAFTSSASDVEHKEHAVHLQAVWFVPFTDKVSFMFAARAVLLRRQADVRDRCRLHRAASQLQLGHINSLTSRNDVSPASASTSAAT